MPGIDERLCRVDVGMQAILEAHAELDACAVRLLEKSVHASSRDVDWLLDEHVQTVADRRNGLLGVAARRAPNDDEVQAIGQETTEVGVRSCADLFGERRA